MIRFVLNVNKEIISYVLVEVWGKFKIFIVLNYVISYDI